MSTVLAYIEAHEKELTALARAIWEKPEPPFFEHTASTLIATHLEKEGFFVERGAFGLPTAIRASWGSGKPVLGFLGEYDALPGLSQHAAARKSPVTAVDYDHGCGHNLLGVAHVGAVLALKHEMEKRKLSGTLVFYGCPAEEVLTGKGFMAREGAFRELDAHVAFHPGRATYVMLGRHTGVYTAKFHFTGKTAHAGGEPYNGRSALDAAELMNVGANYLREHVPTDVRIHYIISNGGLAPNIVPEHATTYYFVRALSVETMLDTFRRLTFCAEGAAHMTETQLRVEKLGGCYPTRNNRVLSTVLHEALLEAPPISYTSEELAFAHALNQTAPEFYSSVSARLAPESEIFTGYLDPRTADCFGSSDVGDAEHVAPGARFYAASWNLGAPSHSWQVSACSGMSIGMKGMLFGAQVMALFGLKLLERPDCIAAARTEFTGVMQGKHYECLIPPTLSYTDACLTPS